MLPTQISRRGNRNYESPLALVDDLNRALTDWWRDVPDRSLTGVYPVDIREDDNCLYVDAELPGFKPKDVEVTIENGLLHILAQRTVTEEDPQSLSHLKERRFARVARSFTLPNAVDEGKVEAKMEDGVLRLKLNKREEVKPRRIEIK